MALNEREHLMEESAEFPNERKLILRGILHHGRPERYRKASLIFINTGLNDMVGWHRLQVSLARYAARHGYDVLRFDNFGIGDSDGELEDDDIVRIFRRIEQGLWAGDAVCAADYLRAKLRPARLAYVGFCGGGLNAIHAAARDKNADCVVNIAGPVTLTSRVIAKKLDPYHVQSNVERYRRNITNLGSIVRFLTGRSEYRKILMSAIYGIRYRLRKPEPVPSQTDKDGESQGGPLNEAVFKAYEKFARSRKPILFYYAEYDKATWDFKQFFRTRYSKPPLWHDRCEFVEVAQANHIFSDEVSQERIKPDIIQWLQKAGV